MLLLFLCKIGSKLKIRNKKLHFSLVSLHRLGHLGLIGHLGHLGSNRV